MNPWKNVGGSFLHGGLTPEIVPTFWRKLRIHVLERVGRRGVPRATGLEAGGRTVTVPGAGESELRATRSQRGEVFGAWRQTMCYLVPSLFPSIDGNLNVSLVPGGRSRWIFSYGATRSS